MSWLDRYIDDVRVIAPVPGRPLQIERLPDGSTTLVVRETRGARGDVSVAGPRTRALFKVTTDVVRAVIVQFKPGWSMQLLGVPASELTDRIVPLDQLWGGAGSALCEELLAARSVAEVLERLGPAFAARAGDGAESSSAGLARRAVRLLERDEVRLEDVSRQLGITARHLRRVFSENVGMGPKHFARTVRLRRAVRCARTTAAADWGRVAADTGYYDQAHLIAEFRALVGTTPAAFVKRPALLPRRVVPGRDVRRG